METSSFITASDPVARERTPTRMSAALFRLRVAGHQLRRAVQDFFDGPAHFARVEGLEYTFVAGASRTPLWSDNRAAEALYERGKVHNLRAAIEALDGTLVSPGCVFSFWRQIGRASKSRGYETGRMLQQGCMIPAVGGGLCQLSNALYDVASQTDCEIVERHAHSRVVAGSAAAAGRDATVAWNYVDLRFRAPQPLLIRAKVVDDQLVVSFCACPDTPLARKSRDSSGIRVPSDSTSVHPPAPASTCGTCAETSCFRKEN
jgi:vancomycin resistance protein YoaR